jgi:hypothetical protein
MPSPSKACPPLNKMRMFEFMGEACCSDVHNKCLEQILLEHLSLPERADHMHAYWYTPKGKDITEHRQRRMPVAYSKVLSECESAI